MSLADILSWEGIQQVLTPVIQERVMKLRLVNRKVMVALESNPVLIINVRISHAGVKGLSAEFLQRWKGSVHLHCKLLWEPGSRWLKEVRDALASDRLRPLSLLSLSVGEKHLHPLVNELVGIGPAIHQLEIAYRGHGAELHHAAEPLASLGCALTMKISAQGMDQGGAQTTSWLRHTLASSISIVSLSLRYLTLPNHAAPSTTHP